MPKEAFAAIRRVGVVPGVKTDSQRLVMNSAMVAGVYEFEGLSTAEVYDLGTTV